MCIRDRAGNTVRRRSFRGRLRDRGRRVPARLRTLSPSLARGCARKFPRVLERDCGHDVRTRAALAYLAPDRDVESPLGAVRSFLVRDALLNGACARVL